MSTVLDETAADVPVRDMAVNLSQLTAALQDSWVHQNARTRQDISRVSREVLEDRFLHLHDENLLLKEHNNNQEDKIKKLSTKLMKLVKDRGRMEKLAAGGAQPVSRVRDVEMEEMMEELQEKVRGLQAENEGLKQRLLVAKHQLINVQSKRPSPYRHVQSRVNTGLKKLPDDTSSPSQTRPKTTRNLDGGGRPPSGQLPRYGHSLLEESRAESRNLEKVIESQRSQMEEMEGELEQLWEQLGKKEAEYEERLLQVRQQQTNKLRSHVNDNTTMIKLQKQLADRSNAVTELEGRFLQLQESQRMLRASYDAAMLKVDELLAQLKDERLKSLEMKKWLQSSNTSKIGMEQVTATLHQVHMSLRENMSQFRPVMLLYRTVKLSAPPLPLGAQRSHSDLFLSVFDPRVMKKIIPTALGVDIELQQFKSASVSLNGLFTGRSKRTQSQNSDEFQPSLLQSTGPLTRTRDTLNITEQIQRCKFDSELHWTLNNKV